MVYFIDSDISLRRAFELFLESANLEHCSFGTAEEFLSEVDLTMSDILVLDLSLPGMNGTDLLKNLDETGIHLPVIVISSFDDPQSRKCCRKYGVKAFLRKPVDGEALIDLIKYNIAQ